MSNGRDLNWNELRAQIGGMTVLAISGGRVVRVDDSTVDLPVSSGYKVRISLAANDTYTVERVMVRGAKTWIKGARTDVYCDNVSDVAYAASCYKNVEF